jgi:hypothetical protein
MKLLLGGFLLGALTLIAPAALVTTSSPLPVEISFSSPDSEIELSSGTSFLVYRGSGSGEFIAYNIFGSGELQFLAPTDNSDVAFLTGSFTLSSDMGSDYWWADGSYISLWVKPAYSDETVGNIVPGETGYLGFRVSAGDSQYYYGYVSAFLAPDGSTLTVDEVVWNNVADAGITVVPEPSSLLLGALGVLPLLRRRRAA